MAVAVFFILSGFLITLKLNKEKPKQFAIKRIIRLYPSYFVAMILTTVVMIIAGDEFKSKVCNLKEWIINLTMFPGYFNQKPVDGVYWTLGVEILFYAIIWFLMVIKKRQKIEVFSFIWLIISLITNLMLIRFDNVLLKGLRIIGITQYCQLFITGIIMCLLYKKEKSKITYVTLILCIVNQFIALGIKYTIFLCLFNVVFYFIIVRRLSIPSFINNKVITFLATISYPLYLTHQFIGFAIINKLEKLGLINEIYILLPIAIVVGIAYLIHKFIERPSVKFLSRKILKN